MTTAPYPLDDAPPTSATTDAPTGIGLAGWLSVVITLTVGLALTLVFLFGTHQWQQQQLNRVLQQAVTAQATALHQTLDHYRLTLVAVAGLCASQQTVEAAAFRRWAAPLLTELRGLAGLGWVVQVAAAEWAEFVAIARQQNGAEFDIVEVAGQGPPLPVLADHDVHYPVWLAEPLTGLRLTPGFDLGTVPAVREHLYQARQSGHAQLVPASVLPGEQDNPHQFLLLIPVPVESVPAAVLPVVGRGPAWPGFIVARLDYPTVLRAVLEQGQTKGMAVEWLALSSRPSVTGLPPTTMDAPDPPPVWQASSRFTFANSEWQLIGQPTAAFFAANRELGANTAVVLMAGLSLTLLAAAYLYRLLRKAARIEAIMVDRTSQVIATNLSLRREISERAQIEKALRESESILRAMVDASPAAIYLKDTRGRFVLANQKYEAFFSTGRPMEGRTVFDIFPPQQAAVYAEQDQQVMTAGTSLQWEVDVSRANGEVMGCLISKFPLRDADGKIIGVGGISTDITARRHAEQALRDSETRFRAIFDGVNDAIFLHDGTSGAILDVNQRVSELYGYSRDEICRLGVGELSAGVPPYTQEDALAWLGKALAGAHPVFEWHAKDRSGRLFWVEISMRQVTIADQEQVIVTVRDVTQRKQSEQALRLSEQRLRQIIDLVPHFIFAKDIAGRFILANQAVAEAYGTTVEVLTGKTEADFVRPVAEVRDGREHDMAVLSGNKALLIPEEQLTDARGHLRLLQTTKIPFTFSGAGTPAVLGVAVDITERKRAEQALLDSETRWQFALESARDGVWDFNIQTGRVFYSKRWKEMLGYAEADLDGHVREWRKRLHPEDKARVYGEVEKHFAGETPFYENEYRMLCKDGTYKWLLARGKIIQRDTAGKPLRMIGTHTDISARKQAEQEVQRLRNLLGNIIDSMPSVLVGVNPDGRVTQWNREAERLTGVPATAAQGRGLAEVFPPLANKLEAIRQAIQSGQPLHDSKVARHVAGETRYADITIYPLISNGTSGAVIRLDDVTERVRLEEMMIQSEKMLSVGGLAAGMAHEINNPLAGILQNAQVVCNRLQAALPRNQAVAAACGVDLTALAAYLEQRGVLGMLETIQESGRRAARIVENMLSFSRKSESRRAPHDLRDLLDRTVELAANDYDLKKKYDFRRIQIVRDYASDLPLVCCEATKIQQVFLNILKNGAQAMAAGKTSRRAPCFMLRMQAEDGWVRVEIEDNGPGMPEAVRKRVFEPFFTTKAVGEGTGLGLSVSYFIIVENHHGTLTVEAAPEQGTRFSIRLPTACPV